MNWKRIVLLIVLVVLVGLQFFVKKDNVSSYESVAAFETQVNLPAEIKTIFESTCYDCHSAHTNYPWYASIGAVSLILDDHIEEGREHLDFSNWDSYPEKRQLHKLAEVYEEVEEDEMPLKMYRITHGGLSDAERESLLNWASAYKESH